MAIDLSRLSGRRTPVALLLASAVAAGAWIAYEGDGPTVMREDGTVLHKPYVPTQGDVPTIGHGSTHYEDGTRVQLSDPPITRRRARDLALGELERTYARCVRTSLPDALMSQAEFDIAVDFAGQYGCRAWAGSSMRAFTAAGDYRAACEAYLKYRFMTSTRREGAGWVQTRPGVWRFDCATPGNRVCSGVWIRQQSRHAKCLSEGGFQ